ncbi:NAD+--asparagine ADP-ribosyltransferase [Alloiococcus otitis]|uniref:Phage head morphogenesis domain-containing protein n=1 Tax=Alloiococcus otitis ATCC 51267 TaxID=883081 RepID=K9E866_9LACT|nr:minor capsid protein [Alloiococcus otitis]EKU92853.1 hypothetical protein HMPREF9698_01606 [Alloiococcus otitis ATCC 51267]SUU91681.1 NAD+--asparagine ADP-ribosyltransferase [Alloiococcus otitis]
MASSYWRRRIKAEMKVRQQQDEDIGKVMQRLHDYYMEQIRKEIESFVVRYGLREQIEPSEVRKLVEEFDVQFFADKARRYVEEKNFSDRANRELALYNLKMKMSRGELLMRNIDLELVALADDEHKLTDKYLNEAFVQEQELQAGIMRDFVPDPEDIGYMARAIINTPYLGATWSERIWDRQDKLRKIVAELTQTAVIRGRNAVELIPLIREQMDVSAYAAKRLAVTEVARIQTAVQKENYRANDFREYEYIAEPTACDICAELDGKIFKVANMQPGENSAPMHPHCHCSTAPVER